MKEAVDVDVDVDASVRPPAESAGEWRAYWRAAGQAWRREPEISASRKRALRFRLGVARERDAYPFKDIEPHLTRADIEWLLTQDGRGPVDAYAPEDDGRMGLDLRGADVRGLDLSGLPLARMRGGLAEDEWRFASREQLEAAAARLDGARMEGTHLEGAVLPGAHLESVVLEGAYLDGANLSQAHLGRASLLRARLTGAFLGGADLTGAQLDGALLQGAFLVGARLDGASLAGTQAEGAILRLAHLEGADVRGAHLEGADLSEAFLGGTILANAVFDGHTSLRRAALADREHGAVALADVSWGSASVGVTDWSRVRRLGDERIAQARRNADGTRKSRRQRLDEYLAAVRAYQQAASVVGAAGLRKEARRFSYRALAIQRTVWRRRWRPTTYALWWLLFLVTGYGYKPLRALGCYLLVVAAFTAVYVELAHAALASILAWKDAAILSVGAFHGAALFAMAHHQAGPITTLVIAEAALGLVIELTVIASFARRPA